MSDEQPELVIVDGRAWPLLAGHRYQFTGEELQQLLSDAAVAVTEVYLREGGEPIKVTELADGSKFVGEEAITELHAFAVLAAQRWAKAHDRAQGLLGAGSVTVGSAGVETLRRLIDGEGTPQERDQFAAILDTAIEAGEKAEEERT